MFDVKLPFLYQLIGSELHGDWASLLNYHVMVAMLGTPPDSISAVKRGCCDREILIN